MESTTGYRTKRASCRDSIFCSVLTAVAWAIPAAVSQPAAAQAADDDPSAGVASGLEEIVVTSRRREESLQDVPISVSAFSGEDLEKRQVRSLDQIQAFTPNLVFNASAAVSGSNSAAAVFIRGIGQRDFTLNADPGVGIYVDGVYLARAAGSVLGIVDVEQVEVLRGPQGTLFGRNTIGGAINLTTKRPATTLGGQLELGTGSDNLVSVRGSVDIPFGERVLSKFSVQYTNQDGFVEKVLQDQTVGDKDALTARARLIFTITDALEFDLAVDGTRARENGAPLVLVASNEAASFPGFHNAVLVGPPCVPFPGSVSDARCYNPQWVPGKDSFSTFATGRTGSNLDMVGGSGTFRLDLDALQLKSITAFRRVDASFGRDEDHSPILIAETFNSPFEHRQFSQEFQLTGESADRRITWVSGVYYFKESGSDRDNVTFNVVALQSGGEIENESYAAFGEADFRFAERWTVTGGLRYSQDDKRWRPDQFVKSSLIGIAPGTRIQPFVWKEISASEVTPRVVLRFQPNDSFNTYASYSRGFKSGGFSQRIFPPQSEIPSFKPEYADVYEVGIKVTGLENRLRVNAAAFHTKYKDMQILVSPPDTPATITDNAAAARIRGLEIEASFTPVAGLTLQGGVGYLDGEYRDVNVAASEVTGASELVNAPEWSLNAALSYDYALSGGDSFGLRLDGSYTSRVFNDAANTPALMQGGYAIMNAMVNRQFAQGRYEVYAGVQNILDRHYIVGGYADLRDLGIAEAVLARPRSWTAGVKVLF